MRKTTNYLFAAFLTAALAASANAAVIISSTSEATPGLAGFQTFTVTAESDQGPVNGIAISFDGAMNQVNPFGLATIFQDNNGAVVGSGADVREDSQFLFNSADILSLNTDESAILLTGALTNLAGLNTGNAIAFAQIVIPDGGSVGYDGGIDDGGGTSVPVMGELTAGGGGGDAMVVGDPVDGSDLSAALQAAFDNRNGGDAVVPDAIMVSNGNGDFSELGVGTPVVGRTDLLAGILIELVPGSAEGKFDLVMSGDFAAFAPDSAVAGTILIPTENGGDLNYTFGANVPEPSTVLLAGLGLIGLVGFSRRK